MVIVLEPLAFADPDAQNAVMDAGLAVLEEIAASSRTVLKEIRDDIRDIRDDIPNLRNEVRSEVKSIRDRQDSDLRLVVGALFAVALGLASLMAKGIHWL